MLPVWQCGRSWNVPGARSLHPAVHSRPALSPCHSSSSLCHVWLRAAWPCCAFACLLSPCMQSSLLGCVHPFVSPWGPDSGLWKLVLQPPCTSVSWPPVLPARVPLQDSAFLLNPRPSDVLAIIGRISCLSCRSRLPCFGPGTLQTSTGGERISAAHRPLVSTET